MFSWGGIFSQVSHRKWRAVVKFALRHLREFALREALDWTRQAGAQSGFVQFAGARGMPRFAHDSRKAQHFDGMVSLGMRGVFNSISAIKQAQNFSCKRGESAQVPFGYGENSHQWLGWTARRYRNTFGG